MDFKHPVWLVGFRAFFIAGMAAGTVLPLVWGLSFHGLAILPVGHLTPLQWHSHEMLFGFGWAVLGGFLLTATKNWVKVRGYHGATLAMLVGLWVLERLILSFGGALPAPLFHLGANLFLTTLSALVILTLVRNRKNDTFPDNFYFVGALPLFIVAKNLLLLDVDHPGRGASLAIGLFRVAIVVMLERTVVAFMRAQLQTEIGAPSWMNTSIKALTGLAAFEAFFDVSMSAVVCGVLAALLLVRWFMWRPLVALRRLDVGIMYAGYLALVIHLALSALQYASLWSGVGTLTIHAFTYGSMGLIIAAMIVRISMGHTGRKIAFDAWHKAALWIIVGGALSRLLATQLDPGHYPAWVLLSAAAWSLAYAMLAVRLTPLLLRARVDGKEH
jgi:uncharacterized protein involved in response to NO